MAYRFLEDVAIADVAFEASGKTLRELFEEAALALSATMVRDVERIDPNVRKSFEVEAETVEMLLFHFLQELIFYKDAEQLLLGVFDLDIVERGAVWHLAAKAYGEGIAQERHELLADVKAVSLHNFKVEETEEGWRATVILDV